MASNLKKIVSLREKRILGNSWFCNITKLPWNSRQNFISFLCQGPKLSPRSIWPNYLLPEIHIKIGVRAQNSQLLSHSTCAKIPVEIFNWVQTPINRDALIQMLIKLSFVLPCCRNNVALILNSSGGADYSFSRCADFPLQPAGASHRHEDNAKGREEVSFLVCFLKLSAQMDSWLSNHDQTLNHAF